MPLAFLGSQLSMLIEWRKYRWIFLWIGAEENKRYHLVSWDNFYLPKFHGGLGIRKIRHLNNALLGKKIWHIF